MAEIDKIGKTYIMTRLVPKDLSVCNSKNKNDEFRENVAEKLALLLEQRIINY